MSLGCRQILGMIRDHTDRLPVTPFEGKIECKCTVCDCVCVSVCVCFMCACVSAFCHSPPLAPEVRLDYNRCVHSVPIYICSYLFLHSSVWHPLPLLVETFPRESQEIIEVSLKMTTGFHGTVVDWRTNSKQRPGISYTVHFQQCYNGRNVNLCHV